MKKWKKDTEIARQFVELGYRGIGRTISRREFVKRKERAQSVFIARREIAIPILSDCLSVTKPLPLALAAREELNRTARLLTIVFIRDRNDLSEEISGYIDFSQRLKTEDLTNFFLGRTKLLPQTSDLSFYNWNTNFTVHNDTKNFRFHPDVQGIRFRCEHDRKFVLIDPQITEEQHGTARSVIQTSEYLQVVLYVRFVDRNEFEPRLNQFFSFSRITGWGENSSDREKICFELTPKRKFLTENQYFLARKMKTHLIDCRWSHFSSSQTREYVVELNDIYLNRNKSHEKKLSGEPKPISVILAEITLLNVLLLTFWVSTSTYWKYEADHICLMFLLEMCMSNATFHAIMKQSCYFISDWLLFYQRPYQSHASSNFKGIYIEMPGV